MGSNVAKWSMLLGAAAIVFGVSVAVGLKLLPSPHTDTDFLVVGSVATFLSLGVLFAVLIRTWIRTPDVFFKKRPKATADEIPAGNLPSER